LANVEALTIERERERTRHTERRRDRETETKQCADLNKFGGEGGLSFSALQLLKMMLHELRREIQVTAVLRCNARIFRMGVKGQVALLLSPLPIFKVGRNLGGTMGGERELEKRDRQHGQESRNAVCVCVCVCVRVCVCARARALRVVFRV
jgi:hypothetical protein